MSHEPVRYADTLIFPAMLDPHAVATVRRLNEAGLQAYLVGGCVRDLLLGLIPKDFDVSTEASPRQIRRLFRNSRIIGRRFKLAHVHWPGGKIIEVATFRRTPEGSGEPGVQSDLLITQDNEFGNAEEDVLRRDFTINALLYDVRTAEVIDYIGGVQDLRERLLRTIGDPATRFAEDPVRMLRAIKFLARLDLQPTPEVAAAMSEQSEQIARSSPARVLEEIYKLMACGRAGRALPMLVERGLLGRLLPEVAPYWAANLAQLAAVGAGLDRIDHGRRRVGNDFLLAVLCLGPWIERTRDTSLRDPLLVAHDLFDHAALRMSIPRRDMASLRHILVTLSRFERPHRSRRFRIVDFLRRPTTLHALDLLYVGALAGLLDPELHAHWAQRAATLEPSDAAGSRTAAHDEEVDDREPGDDQDAGRDAAFAEEAPGRRGRRRHRGGRGRRGGRQRREAALDQPVDRPFGPYPEQPARADGAPQDGHSDELVPATGDASRDNVPRRTDGASAPPAGEGPRRRRRRGRRGRGRGRDGRSDQPVDKPALPAAAQDAQPSAPTEPGQPAAPPAEPRRENGGRGRAPRRGGRDRSQRRDRGGRGRQGTQSGRDGGGQKPNAPQRAPRDEFEPGKTPPPQGPGQRNPEDVEDFFDW